MVVSLISLKNFYITTNKPCLKNGPQHICQIDWNSSFEVFWHFQMLPAMGLLWEKNYLNLEIYDKKPNL